ncbi:hypothetical protein Y032_0030g2158 [Ancylostoma ceylanicum]|uniref:Uncharacterized protein n=1 Tax=Ancylostoma ceylanicum TaxID=53326 RepID=A0A016US21_9BILA|nr:hypothetical protein Y032_0030g2158 [Ancylostoma ceylanicum]
MLLVKSSITSQALLNVTCVEYIISFLLTFSLFRPLKDDDVLYYWGEGLCPVGRCRPPTYGCNEDTGLCFTPVPTTTTTTTFKPIICHPLGCWGYPF